MLNESNLHSYQRHAVERIVETPKCGLLLEMGLGKTVSTLTAINRLIYEELEISTVLVIAPKRVVESVWAEEVENWDHLRHLKVSKIIGTEAKRKQALRVKADIYIISRDNVAWLTGQYGGLMLPFDMLVIDESSSFKSPKSMRFKALKRIAFERVVILTGTPAPNGLIDLWSQVYLLDRGERLGKTIGAYRERYFKPGQRNGHIVYNYKIRDEGEAAIHRQIDDICMSMKAVDFLDMPEKVEKTVTLKMPEEVRDQYKAFEREQVLELMQGEITAVNAAALSNKLLQFANGAVYDENREVHEVHKVKLMAVEEIIEQAGGKPVLIAWTYQHDRDRLLRHLKAYKPVQLKGEAEIKAWNKGEIQVLLMHPASGGHGLNLQAGGNIVVWFGQTWSLELYQQLNARLYRQGQQADRVFIYLLVTFGTLDMDVVAALGAKSGKQEGLMNAIKARLREYRLD